MRTLLLRFFSVFENAAYFLGVGLLWIRPRWVVFEWLLSCFLGLGKRLLFCACFALFLASPDLQITRQTRAKNSPNPSSNAPKTRQQRSEFCSLQPCVKTRGPPTEPQPSWQPSYQPSPKSCTRASNHLNPERVHIT